MKLMKNGSRIAMSYGSGSHETATNTVILHLTKGDKVWIEGRGGLNGGGAHYNTFTGYLMFKE